MRYFLGSGFLLVSAWLVYAGIGHRTRAKANALPAPAEESQLQMMGEIVRPIVLFALAYVGLKTTLAYVWLDGSRALSLFDLGGFLILLAAYGFWLTMKTKPVYLPAAERPAAAAERAPVSETALEEGVAFSQLSYNARRKLAVQRNANIRADRVARKLGKVRR